MVGPPASLSEIIYFQVVSLIPENMNVSLFKSHIKRSFGYAGPTLWNDLPFEIRGAKDINYFKSLMKTHFFRLAYDL